MSRPDDLPDYTNPPLNEVVLGIQFAPPRGYQRIFSYEVWQLFRDNFPLVQELPPLPPTFEMFGLPASQQFNFEFGFESSRNWFVSKEQDELIQFQSDKLIHNWRKVGNQNNEYPRFEFIVDKFEKEIKKLDEYFSEKANQHLEINQCEVTYINHIYVGTNEDDLTPSKALKFIQFGDHEPDDISFSFRNTIYDADGHPIGRITCEAQPALNNINQKSMIALTITARGAPKAPTIPSALNFLQIGRAMVVNTFTQVTTEACHERWGRTK